MRVRRFLHILLLVGVFALLWQVVTTWRRPVPDLVAASQESPPGEAPLPLGSEAVPGAGKQLATTISDKDLFSPSRSRVIAEVAPIQETIPPPSHLKLVGVFLTPKREEAFFVDSSQGGKVVRVRKGETLGSYRLVAVTPLHASMTTGQDGEEVSLPLTLLDSPSATKAPRLVPTGQRAGVQRAGQVKEGAAQAQGGIPDEAGVRQDILRLQQRLRQIRRKAIRAQAEAEDSGNNDDGEEEEEEDEE